MERSKVVKSVMQEHCMDALLTAQPLKQTSPVLLEALLLLQYALVSLDTSSVVYPVSHLAVMVLWQDQKSVMQDPIMDAFLIAQL
jgi:hypothetical protein